MKGLLAGAILLPAIVLITLSQRPGGFRNALRNVVRRLKLFLVLAGVYLLTTPLLRLLLKDTAADLATAAVAAVLAVVFLIQAQDRQLPG